MRLFHILIVSVLLMPLTLLPAATQSQKKSGTSSTTKKPSATSTKAKPTGKSTSKTPADSKSSTTPEKASSPDNGSSSPSPPDAKTPPEESAAKTGKAAVGTSTAAAGGSAQKETDATATEGPNAGKKPAAVSSITPEELEGFESYSPELQGIVRRSLELTTQNLRYQFGSADPNAGGMDCSGTIYRVLQDAGLKEVPRQSDEICRWVMRRSALFRTEDTTSLKDGSLSSLKPGDLLFWSGTYETSTPRELPISHVMLYLGKRKKDGKPIVFGASDGRSYDGQRRNGVSVFDFVMPRREGKAAFYGYGRIPGLKSHDAAGKKESTSASASRAAG